MESHAQPKRSPWDRPPLLSVILVNWNTRELADAAISSLLKHETRVPLEIIVVDNASRDGSADYLESLHPGIRVIRNRENEGFARANNRAAAMAIGEYLLLLNTDTLFDTPVLERCLELAEARRPVLVGCRLLNVDGSIQVSAEAFPTLWGQFSEIFAYAGRALAMKRRRLQAASAPMAADWLCGAFLLVPRNLYLDLGGLDSDIFMYGEDMEFCWRARKLGVGSWHVPDVSIIHLGGGGVDHASLRALLLSDAGRLKAFEKIRGRGAARLLRLILIARSASRAALWGSLGLLRGDPNLRRKARNHAIGLLVMAGGANLRHFV